MELLDLNSTRKYEECAIIYLNSTIILCYISGLENQRLIELAMLSPKGHKAHQNYFMLAGAYQWVPDAAGM